MRCPSLPVVERRKAIGRAVIATPAWQEDEHGSYLEIVRALDSCPPARSGIWWWSGQGIMAMRRGKGWCV